MVKQNGEADMKSIKQAVILSAVLITGCAVGPNYQEPQVRVPDSYGQTATTQPASTQPATVTAAAPVAIPAAWWTTFNDETLNRLIADARESNLDLRAAAARVREARAARGIV